MGVKTPEVIVGEVEDGEPSRGELLEEDGERDGGKGTPEGETIDPGLTGATATKTDLASLRTAAAKSEDFPLSPVRKESIISDMSDDDTDDATSSRGAPGPSKGTLTSPDARSDAGKPGSTGDTGAVAPLETWKLFQDFGG